MLCGWGGGGGMRYLLSNSIIIMIQCDFYKTRITLLIEFLLDVEMPLAGGVSNICKPTARWTKN